MNIKISPANISGKIQAPASKSSMQRACAAALLANGTTQIFNYGTSNDDNAALHIIEQLGATVTKANENIVVKSKGVAAFNSQNPTSIHCGESGLSIRMFTPIAALYNSNITITGEGSLSTRPMDFFDEVLPNLAVAISSNNGKLPINVQGPLQPKNIEIDGSLSSQFLTGLLMAYSASPNPSKGGELNLICEEKSITITVNNLSSKPYIDLTIDVMKKFGMLVPENYEYEEFTFNYANQPTNQSTNQPITYTVEGDWSGAAFLLVAAAIAGKITVTGIDVQSTQADKKIIHALKDCGAIVNTADNEVTVSKSNNPLHAFAFDATHCPDLFPPLVALASYCTGTTVIKGVNRLIHKESNRALSLQQEFGKLGVFIFIEDDYMKIKGGKPLQAAQVSSHHDHRIAMACAVAALAANGNTVVECAEAVNKSYPNFYEHLAILGAAIETF